MTTQTDVQPDQPGLQQPKRSFSKLWWILGVLFLLAVLVVVAWKLFLPKLKGGKEVVLTWWGLWEDELVIRPLIEEYQKTHPQVKINYIRQSPQDYRERLTNALAKGKGPDIFRFHNSWVPMFAKELDRVPPTIMSPAEYAEAFYPVIPSDLTSGAGLVGIPLGYDALVLYINEDIFTSSGKTPPTTWDELRQTALDLTTKDDKGLITQAGVALGRTENVDHWPEILALMILQNGGNPAKPTDKRAQDALVFFTLFSSVDSVWDETLPPSTVAFAAGKLAMMFGPSWRAFEIKEQNPDLNFKTYPLPQLPKDRPGQPDVSYATYWVEGVWSRSENKQAAWDFLKFISTKESLQKLYQNESKTRLFGEPYPRRDLSEFLIDHPLVGAVIKQAPDAQSWYLQSRTFDGPTGINSLITKYYEDAVNSVNSGIRVDKALETVASGVAQVLAQYGR
jgi:multiple sugar transport system substrate-binding protein